MCLTVSVCVSGCDSISRFLNYIYRNVTKVKQLLSCQGPEEDQDPESELSVSELMQVAEERKKKLQQLEEEEAQGEKKQLKKSKEEEGNKRKTGGEEDEAGISWGMSKYCVGLLC